MMRILITIIMITITIIIIIIIMIIEILKNPFVPPRPEAGDRGGGEKEIRAGWADVYIYIYIYIHT